MGDCASLPYKTTFSTGVPHEPWGVLGAEERRSYRSRCHGWWCGCGGRPTAVESGPWKRVPVSEVLGPMKGQRGRSSRRHINAVMTAGGNGAV